MAWAVCHAVEAQGRERERGGSKFILFLKCSLFEFTVGISISFVCVNGDDDKHTDIHWFMLMMFECCYLFTYFYHYFLS